MVIDSKSFWKKTLMNDIDMKHSQYSILANHSIVQCEVDSWNELDINKSSVTYSSSNDEIQSQRFSNTSVTNDIFAL